MARYLRILTVASVVLAGCERPDPEQVEFDKKFDRDAVLVKICRDDPTIAGGSRMRVYRFQDKLWFLEYKRRWRQLMLSRITSATCLTLMLHTERRAKSSDRANSRRPDLISAARDRYVSQLAPRVCTLLRFGSA